MRHSQQPATRHKAPRRAHSERSMSVPTRTNTTSDRRAFLNVCHPLPYPHHPHHPHRCDCPLWQTYSSSQRWWPKPPKKTRRKVSRPAASVCKCRPLPSASHCDVSAAHCLSKWTKCCLCVCSLDELESGSRFRRPCCLRSCARSARCPRPPCAP